MFATRKIRGFYPCLVSCLFAGVGGVSAGSLTLPPRVAVVPFKIFGDVGIKQADEHLANLFATTLRNRPVVLADRLHLDKVLQEVDLKLAHIVENPSLVWNHKLSGVDMIVTGTAAKTGSAITVTSFLINLSGEVSIGSHVTVDDEKDMPDAMERLSRALFTSSEERRAELELELAHAKDRIASMEKEVEALKTFRSLSGDQRAVIHLLLEKGHWRPVPCVDRGRCVQANARYAGRDPQEYSMQDLRACGALNPTPEGLYALYIILANPFNDRPRQPSSWVINKHKNVYIHWDNVRYEAEMAKDKALWIRLEEVQKFLIEYQEGIVASGWLRP